MRRGRHRARSATTSSRVVAAHRSGVPLADALARWRSTRPLPGVRLTASALELGLAAGGTHARAVDGVAATLRDNLAISAEVRARSCAGAGIGSRHRARADRLHRARVPGRPSHRLVPLPDASGPRLPRGRRRTRRRGGDVDGADHPHRRIERVGSRVRMGRALVVAAAWASRPAPRRVRRSPLADRCRSRRPRRSPLRVVGRMIRSRLGRRDDPAADARLGRAVLAAVLVLPVVPLLAPDGRGDVGVRRVAWAATPTRPKPTSSTWAPRGRRSLRRRHRRGPQRATRAACDRPALPRAIRRRTEVDRHPDRDGHAYCRRARSPSQRLGEPVRPLSSALIASERYGVPLTASLERLADEVRRDRRRHAEAAARRVPVKLLFPLVFCSLPALALLSVAPLIAGALRALRT